MQVNSLTIENSVNSFIDNLRKTLAISESNVPMDDVLLLDILLSLEHVLDRSRVFLATQVPTEDRICTSDQLHIQLDALRNTISERFKSLPVEDARTVLQSRLTEAGSSWWHVVRPQV